ncbi:hypothetical protein [Clostridium botulinum]|uniref:hypothetical protein n=1 Tax=Clostridium botulinum TaxID=1491 RepID=UPI0007739A13|nr:hypothetical protein [Clostridium botulinum]MBN1043760.1 transcriptional regulator [Clostridium botulinum]NFE93691.1 transcriptional regulator [Clostridium botulinum]NFL38441.1 transcriptional regulator [Clostridium botulinum]NFL65881.1 transcriptional regulator [Clostridium botulinum]NFN08278.1 transcriptional regulator [Clostridium botulinum]
MKYKKMTPHELAIKTVNDIEKRRKAEREGKVQASLHLWANRKRIERRLGYGRY